MGRSRSRNHHVCVFSSTKTTFLIHKRSERATEENDGVAPSPSRKTRPRNKPPQRQGRATPFHTSTRRRRAPVAATGMWRGTLLKRTARRTRHASKANDTHNKQPATQKNSTRRERLAQARTANQGPGPAPPRRPLHIIQVERPANKAAPPKQARPSRVPTATRSVRPQKHERRVR